MHGAVFAEVFAGVFIIHCPNTRRVLKWPLLINFYFDEATGVFWGVAEADGLFGFLVTALFYIC